MKEIDRDSPVTQAFVQWQRELAKHPKPTRFGSLGQGYIFEATKPSLSFQKSGQTYIAEEPGTIQEETAEIAADPHWESIKVTNTEAQLLGILQTHPNETVTYPEFVQAGYGKDTVKVHISRMHHKLPTGMNNRLVNNHNFGYYWRTNDATEALSRAARVFKGEKVPINKYQIGPLLFRPLTSDCVLDGKTIHLGPTEADVMNTLCQRYMEWKNSENPRPYPQPLFFDTSELDLKVYISKIKARLQDEQGTDRSGIQTVIHNKRLKIQGGYYITPVYNPKTNPRSTT